jgi:Fe-S cluster assembly scaffold protein SufB
MTIHSFLKAEKGDPDWQYTPEKYFGKEFKLADANTIEMIEGHTDQMVLRQNPTEKELLAKQVKIIVKPNSNLDMIIFNDADSKMQQIFLYNIHIEVGGTINFGIFVKGGKFNKHIVQVYLEDSAEFNSYGLISNNVGGDTELITKVIHQHPNSVSNQFILGMAGKDSQTVFQGMSALDVDSDGSEAHIESVNMIVGKKGRCFGKPDVYTNCDHAISTQLSSTESLNKDKIYYLQSKGLTENKATDAILNSFQNQVISIIPYPDLREEANQLYLY